MTALYEIANQIVGLSRLMDEGEMDEQTLADSWDGLQGDLSQKTESLLAHVANIGSDVNAVDAEIKRLKARKTTMQNRQKALREYLRFNMDNSDISKIDCPLFSVTLIKPKPMVVITDGTALPPEYVRKTTKVEPVKADILKALKAGTDVPGALLGESIPGLLIK